MFCAICVPTRTQIPTIDHVPSQPRGRVQFRPFSARHEATPELLQLPAAVVKLTGSNGRKDFSLLTSKHLTNVLNFVIMYMIFYFKGEEIMKSIITASAMALMLISSECTATDGGDWTLQVIYLDGTKRMIKNVGPSSKSEDVVTSELEQRPKDRYANASGTILFHGRNALDPDKTLAEHGIQNGDTLYCLLPNNTAESDDHSSSGSSGSSSSVPAIDTTPPKGIPLPRNSNASSSSSSAPVVPMNFTAAWNAYLIDPLQPGSLVKKTKSSYVISLAVIQVLRNMLLTSGTGVDYESVANEIHVAVMSLLKSKSHSTVANAQWNNVLDEIAKEFNSTHPNLVTALRNVKQ
ncbi:MAG: EsaB/YukD family protein [Holosporaceae bacterium]|jgi:hypothetical protein|nr:EsaB/YukD family protein [Holosporaceae bacterium]